ncbi:MAG: GNAT family N-acetyltransferase [Alkalinema sp. CAN_BIN05]|nr:GNAT family N-acetyltransferase [Alkalinema sp. CAN_BIN05]
MTSIALPLNSDQQQNKYPVPITVRSAQLTDIAGMSKVLVQGFNLVPYVWMHPIAQAGIQADLKMRMERKSLYQAFVAVDPDLNSNSILGAVVGTVEVTLQKPNRSCQPTSYAYLASLTVARDYRRLGVAQQLIQACERQVGLWNQSDLYLHVLAENAAARRLYLQLGYGIHRTIRSWNPSLWHVEEQMMLHRHVAQWSQN